MVQIIDNLAISLLSKPFAVLYGPSGTGKTRAAIELASKINNTINTQRWFPIEADRNGNILNGDSTDFRNMVNENNGNYFTVRSNYGSTNASIEFCRTIEMNSVDADTFLSEERNNLEISAPVPFNIPCHKVIPIGSNWNDNKHLMGYINPFGPNNEYIYELTPFIELLILANHPTKRNIPFFAILDEMNLSHIEYYLSDILSVMEISEDSSNNLISFENLLLIQRNLQNRSGESEYYNFLLESVDNLIDENSGLPYSNNFFIIGTINIDETTQMLSNKVIDRAHLIKVESMLPSLALENSNYSSILTDQEMLNKFQEINEYKAEKQIENSFVTCYKELVEEYEITIEEWDWIIDLLDQIYVSLSQIEQEFGYRIIKEVATYLTIGLRYFGNSSEIKNLVNNVLNQKVFAKISGNRRTLEAIIEQLSSILTNYETGENDNYFANSLKRVNELRNKLRLRGQASFIS